jgi:hypothetical protein
MATDVPERQGDRLQRACLLAGIVGLGLCVLAAVAGAFLVTDTSEGGTKDFLAWLLDPTQFFRSYLLAYLCWLGVALGCMALLMIHHLTGGFWGWAIRGALEAATQSLWLLAILFLPLLLGLDRVYPWARWTPEQIEGSRILTQKHLYLNVPFFLTRTAFYLGVWIVLSRLLTRWEEGSPHSPDQPEPRRLRLLSAPGVAAYGLTMTFAAIDWVMSLQPMWFSTIFGAMLAVGQILSGLALAIAVTVYLAPPDQLRTSISTKALRDLGSLMLAFVLLWAYMNYSQFMLIWAGNLPEEAVWYTRRQQGVWGFLAVLLILFNFAFPFLLLLSRQIKQNPRSLAGVAILLLCMRLLDMFWMIVPAFSGIQFRVHWMDGAALVGVGGLWAALFLHYLRRRPLLPAPVEGEANHHA